jgi:hypothetical protein
MPTKARTRGRVIRIASDQGWQVVEPQPSSLYLVRGEARISLQFGARSGRLVGAIYSRPGVVEKPKQAKLAFVTGWLTEPQGQPVASS